MWQGFPIWEKSPSISFSALVPLSGSQRREFSYINLTGILTNSLKVWLQIVLKLPSSEQGFRILFEICFVSGPTEKSGVIDVCTCLRRAFKTQASLPHFMVNADLGRVCEHSSNRFLQCSESHPQACMLPHSTPAGKSLSQEEQQQELSLYNHILPIDVE